MKTTIAISVLLGLSLGGGNIALAGEDQDHGLSVTRLLMPIMSSSRGMDLFVSKGCVTCHAVNGVGGQDASSLDAHNMDEYMNPFDLTAKMWSMAPFMIDAQENELGSQIFFTGDELADIIAFLHDDVQQHEFSVSDLSDEMQEMLEEGHGEDEGEEEGEDHDEEAQDNG